MIDERWSFDRCDDAYTLYNAIELFIEKIGVCPSFPIRTSTKLFEKTVKRKIKIERENLIDYFQPFLDAPDANQIWLRDLDLTERGAKYIHGFDKKSMFLSACSSLEFGEGEYDYLENKTFSGEAIKYTGLFDVEIIWRKQINKPFFIKNLVSANGFFYSAMLEYLMGFAEEIKIKRGWYWRETRKTFDGFYKTISTAKKETSGSSDLDVQCANGAIKSLYTEFFGFLRKRENAENFARDYFRPDWRGLIISQAVANLLRNAYEVQLLTLKKPFAIYHDCLLFASDEPDFNKQFAGTCLLDANKFSHEYTLDAGKVFDSKGKSKLKLVEIDSLGKNQNG